MTAVGACGITLYVGGHAGTVQGEAQTLAGCRMYTAAQSPPPHAPAGALSAVLDSGAFSDRPQDRLTPDAALDRQLRWEGRAAARWERPFQATALVSYDLLIDEVWTAGERHKRRWSIADADAAVATTVEAAAYLASQREHLTPRTLVLSCQGVDAYQYQDCATAVLTYAAPSDWLGLGGWCILGRQTRWLPTFWQTLRAVLPLAATVVRHVHIFGVLYQPALGGLLWLADRHGLTVSTDSTAPMLAPTRGNHKKAGVRVADWRGNIRWWIATLANLRTSGYYRAPAQTAAARQLVLV